MKIIIFTLICILLSIELVYAHTENATFEALYNPSFNQNYSYTLILAGVVALISGIAIFMTGGTASPIVLSIGTWLGTATSGLSGVAATNYGLALLGGGSIASGGFGMLGGAALITAALTFTTDVIFDYTIDLAINEYKYNQLVEQSTNLPSLPLPINSTGTPAYEKAIQSLNDYDKRAPASSYNNKNILRKIINSITNEKNRNQINSDEILKNETFLSLIFFISNDFKAAKEHSFSAITLARSLNVKRTLPAFVFATSSLYSEHFDIDEITNNYFNYSVLAEPEHMLTPLLFSIYLDRLALRLNDETIELSVLDDVFYIMSSSVLKHKRVENYTTLLSRYFVRLKLEQQKIQILTTTSNKTIKESTKTLAVIKKSLLRYETLLSQSKNTLDNYIEVLDEKNRTQLSKFFKLWTSYSNDKERLNSLINKAENNQRCNSFLGYLRCLFKAS